MAGATALATAGRQTLLIIVRILGLVLEWLDWDDVRCRMNDRGLLPSRAVLRRKGRRERSLG